MAFCGEPRSIWDMADNAEGRWRVLVGHGDAAGTLLAFDYDPGTGQLTPAGQTATGASTSFLAVHPGGRVLYLTHNRTDQLSAWQITPGGALEPLGRVNVPAAPGEAAAGPAYVTVDHGGRWLLAANYRGHNAVVFALDPDGRPGALVANVPSGKNAHAIRVNHPRPFAFVPCLGSDHIAQYRLDLRSGALIANEPPVAHTSPGAGPRHLELHPHMPVVYVLGELDAHLYMYLLDGAGLLEPRGRLDTLPDYTGRRWAAHLQADRAGRFLYVSNRAHDSLTVFAIGGDPEQPELVQQLPSGGQTPRHFSLSPDGRYLLVANQDAGKLVRFAVDPASGRLTHLGELPVETLPYFVEFVALPSG
jgi:6-phosphogluconolactonase